MKIYRNNKLDPKQTLIANAKQWLHDNGNRIAADIDRFFETQGGAR